MELNVAAEQVEACSVAELASNAAVVQAAAYPLAVDVVPACSLVAVLAPDDSSAADEAQVCSLVAALVQHVAEVPACS